MRVVKAVLASAVLAGLAIAASSALAAPADGPIRVFVSNQTQVKAKILITGAIGDYGTTLSVNKNGKLNPNGNYEKVTLKKGGFWVNGTALNKKLNGGAGAVVNKTTCSESFTGTGPGTLFKGTGAYAGIGGTVNITVTFAGISPRFTSGAKKGQCNFADNAKPLAQYQSITGTGKVSFS